MRDETPVALEIVSDIATDGPVVALESALITHGFAPPANLEIARRMEATVRETGALFAGENSGHFYFRFSWKGISISSATHLYSFCYL